MSRPIQDWEASALAEVDERAARWRFRPHPAAAGGHLQTFAGALWPRRLALDAGRAETRFVDVDPETKVLLRCSWHEDRRAHPTALVVHGLEGSDASCYVLGTADKLFAAGWNAVRMNIRNCGDTEHLGPALYHSGMSADVVAVLRHLLETERPETVALVGFSLGGNLVVKTAGELGSDAPPELLGVAAVSAALDLRAAADRLEAPANRFYQWRFVRSLGDRMRRKARHYPGRYDLGRLRGMRTVRDYDNRYIAPIFGFLDADDYYERASAIPHVGRVSVPTLLLHSDDDPFVPLTERALRAAGANPRVRIVTTSRGGHVGFVGAAPEDPSEDRHWAENRVVEFLEVLKYNRARSRPGDPSRVLVPY
jgi:predicted alpha/beta-fold hydrolase